MYSIQVLQKERDLLKQGDERIDDLDQSIIALQLIYDPTPGSKIITRNELIEIREKITTILVEEIKEEAILLRIVERFRSF